MYPRSSVNVKKRNMKKTTERHIIIKLLKTSERILKTVSEKKGHYSKNKNHKINKKLISHNESQKTEEQHC